MDLITVLVIFAVVLVCSLIIRIFFAITKVLIIILTVVAIALGIIYFITNYTELFQTLGITLPAFLNP